MGHCQEHLGPHYLPWKLLSTSICPGILQTVFSMVGVASGYCTLRLFFLQWTQVSLSPLAPLAVLPAPITSSTAGGYVPAQEVLHILQKARKEEERLARSH